MDARKRQQDLNDLSEVVRSSAEVVDAEDFVGGAVVSIYVAPVALARTEMSPRLLAKVPKGSPAPLR